RTDLLEHITEQVELLIGVVVAVVVARLSDSRRQGHESNGDRAGREPVSKLHLLLFHLDFALSEPGCRIYRVPVEPQLNVKLRLAVFRWAHRAHGFAGNDPLSDRCIAAAQSGQDRMIAAAVLDDQDFTVAAKRASVDDLPIERGQHGGSGLSLN